MSKTLKIKVPAAAPVPAEEKSQIDFRIVPTDSLQPNEYNPNDMEAEYFESLVGAIKEEGRLNQPVLVRKDPKNEGKFIIVDGENRWKANKYSGFASTPVVVVDYDENMARIRTLSYNQLRGQNIPIKLARLLVDLYKEYTPAEIRRMTGIVEDDQVTAMDLLKTPSFSPDDGIHISATDVERPIQVSLLLLPDEHSAYTTAMKKAMKLVGDDVVALVGHEVQDYDKALKGAMGIAGVKLRNVGLSLICQVFAQLPDQMKEEMTKKAHAIVYAKKVSDAEAKELKKQNTDKQIAA